MNTNQILAGLAGAELRNIEVLSDCCVQGARELCLKIKLRYNSSHETENRLRMDDYLKKWLAVKSKTQKGSTFDRLESTAYNQVIPAFGEMYLDEVTTEYAQTVIDDYADMYSYSTVSKVYQCLNAVMRYALRHHEIAENPIEWVEMPKNDGRTLRDFIVYSPEDCIRIETEAFQRCGIELREPLGTLLPFLLNTGLRIGEALALRWTDVDTTHRFVKIRKNVKAVKNRNGAVGEPHYITIEQKTPKTKSSDRIVKLNQKAWDALEALPKHEQPDLIFSMGEEYLTYASARRLLERICSRAGVAVHGFHAFRHTFATNLFAEGVDAKTVSKILGHSSVKITYDIYIHSIQEQEARAVKLLE